MNIISSDQEMQKNKFQKNVQKLTNISKLNKLSNNTMLQDLIFDVNGQDFPNSTASAVVVQNHLSDIQPSKNFVNNQQQQQQILLEQHIPQQIIPLQNSRNHDRPQLQENNYDLGSNLVGVLSNLKKVVSSKNSRKNNYKSNNQMFQNINNTQEYQVMNNSSQSKNKSGEIAMNDKSISEINSRNVQQQQYQQKYNSSDNNHSKEQQYLSTQNVDPQQIKLFVQGGSQDDIDNSMFNFSLNKKQQLTSKNKGTDRISDAFNNNFFQLSSKNQSKDELLLRQLMTPNQLNQQNQEHFQQFIIADEIKGKQQLSRQKTQQLQQPMSTSRAAQKYIASKKAASVMKNYVHNNSNSRNLNLQSSQSNLVVQDFSAATSTTNQNTQKIYTQQKLQPLINNQSQNNPIQQQEQKPQLLEIPKTTTNFGKTEYSSRNNSTFVGLKTNTQYRQFLNDVQQSTAKLLSSNSQNKSPLSTQSRFIDDQQFSKTQVIRNQSTQQSTRNMRKSIIDGLIRNIQNLNKSEQEKRTERQERDVIIRKNSSKNLILQRRETPKRDQLNQTNGNFNFKVPLDTQTNNQNINNTQNLIDISKLDLNQSNDHSQKSNQSGFKFPTNLNKVHQIIKKNRINFNSNDDYISQQPKQITNVSKKVPLQLQIPATTYLSSKQNKNQNNSLLIAKTESTRDHNVQSNTQEEQSNLQRQTEELNSKEVINQKDSNDIGFKNNFQSNYSKFNNNKPLRQLSILSNVGANITTNHVNNSSIGGSVGRASHHQQNDSSLFDMNMTLQKQGAGGGIGLGQSFGQGFTSGGAMNTTVVVGQGQYMNISQLLKMNMLEDDGIEDMHFYQVAINNHKRHLLIKHEKQLIQLQKNKSNTDNQLRNEKKQQKDKFSLYKNKTKDNELEKTIESIDQDEVYLE